MSDAPAPWGALPDEPLVELFDPAGPVTGGGPLAEPVRLAARLLAGLRRRPEEARRALQEAANALAGPRGWGRAVVSVRYDAATRGLCQPPEVEGGPTDLGEGFLTLRLYYALGADPRPGADLMAVGGYDFPASGHRLLRFRIVTPAETDDGETDVR
jgi:hypothetical protein